MKTVISLFLLVCTAFGQSDRIQLTIDSSEADAVLAIAAKQATGQQVTDPDWQRLFATEPYVRLKKREAGMKRDFTDDQFKTFVLSADVVNRVPELKRTLASWKAADLNASAQKLLAYLPASATIHAKVYPVIKPMHNSFVFETTTNPAIFLYLDPATTADQFANTVTHEMHHVGLSSTSDAYEKMTASLPEGPRKAAEWMGAFGEGMAMLAAAGGPDVNPHAFDPPDVQARWNHDMANFNTDLKKVEAFFLDLAEGRLTDKDKIRERGYEFFGIQGPWYTVGYKMSVMVEKRFGRQALIRCMEDPRKLLATYNVASQKSPEKLEIWSEELLKAVHAEPAQ